MKTIGDSLAPPLPLYVTRRRLFCPAASHRAAQLKVRYLIEQRQPAAILVGDTGVGKSFLIDSFLQEFTQLGDP